MVHTESGFLVLATRASDEDAVKMCRWFQTAILREDRPVDEEVMVPVDAVFALSSVEHQVFWFGPSSVDHDFVKTFVEEISDWEIDVTDELDDEGELERNDDEPSEPRETEPFWSTSASSIHVRIMKSAFAEC